MLPEFRLPSQLKNTKKGAGKHLAKLRAKLGKSVDAERWAAMDTLESTPFPMPKAGFVAVRIVTHTQTEMTAVLDVAERLSSESG